MNIGIIGSGDVGKALARGFKKYNYNVMMGTRDHAKLAAMEKEGVKVGSFADTAKFGELIILATLYTGTENAIKLAGIEHFDNKVIIDCTNPLDFSKGMPPQLLIGHTDSGGEHVQKWLPKAHVVKAFNTVGNAHMVNPDFPQGPPSMFIAGNDAKAKETVTKILHQFGWDVVDTGDITKSRLLEPLCILWVDYGVKHNSWNHAFKLLKK